MRHKKKAVSPVISTVLLVTIALILAVIIFLWARGFIKEAILKEIAGEIKTVEQFCREVSIDPIINKDNSFGFTNTGNVPIFKFNLKLSKSDGSSNIHLISNDRGGRVNPGFATLVEDKGGYSEYEEVKVIPIILGKTKSGNVQEVECDELYAIEL